MCISQPYCLGVPAAKKPSLQFLKQREGRFLASLKFGCSSRADTSWVTLTCLPWGAGDHDGSPAVGSFPCSTSKRGYNVNEAIVIMVIIVIIITIIIIITLKNHAAFLG